MDATKPAYVAANGGVYVAIPTMKLDRNRKIVQMFEAGISKQEIATHFGITRPRVHQVIQRMARMEAVLRR